MDLIEIVKWVKAHPLPIEAIRNWEKQNFTKPKENIMLCVIEITKWVKYHFFFYRIMKAKGINDNRICKKKTNKGGTYANHKRSSKETCAGSKRSSNGGVFYY